MTFTATGMEGLLLLLPLYTVLNEPSPILEERLNSKSLILINSLIF